MNQVVLGKEADGLGKYCHGQVSSVVIEFMLSPFLPQFSFPSLNSNSLTFPLLLDSFSSLPIVELTLQRVREILSMGIVLWLTKKLRFSLSILTERFLNLLVRFLKVSFLGSSTYRNQRDNRKCGQAVKP